MYTTENILYIILISPTQQRNNAAYILADLLYFVGYLLAILGCHEQHWFVHDKIKALQSQVHNLPLSHHLFSPWVECRLETSCFDANQNLFLKTVPVWGKKQITVCHFARFGHHSKLWFVLKQETFNMGQRVTEWRGKCRAEHSKKLILIKTEYFYLLSATIITK